MKSLIEWLGFCKHVWRILDSKDIVMVQCKTVVGSIKTLQCTKCGNLKVTKVFVP